MFLPADDMILPVKEIPKEGELIMNEYLLAIDAGTGSLRAVIVDLDLTH